MPKEKQEGNELHYIKNGKKQDEKLHDTEEPLVDREMRKVLAELRKNRA